MPKLEEIVERRRMEGSSLHLEVTQKVPELVVHERMSHGKGVKGPTEKNRIPGWSIEEKPHIAAEEYTEKWRGLSQSEMDLCWKNLAERMEEVLDKYKVEESKREALRCRGAPLELRRCAKKQEKRKWAEDCWARIFPLFREYNLRHLQSMQEGSAEEGEMKQQRRMKDTKGMTRNIGAKREKWMQRTSAGR